MSTEILDCGHAPSEHSEFTTGYGVLNGKKHCYACCAKHDAEQMNATGKATLYLTTEKAEQAISPAGNRYGGFSGAATVSNWPGSLKFAGRYTKGRHNIAGSRYDVWFRDGSGHRWHGVQYGDNTQIVHCRRCKK